MSLARAEHKLISSWDLLDVSLSILMFSAVSCMNFNLQVSFMHRKMRNYYVPIIIIYYKKKCHGWSVLGFLIYLRIIQNLCLHKLLFFLSCIENLQWCLDQWSKECWKHVVGCFLFQGERRKKIDSGLRLLWDEFLIWMKLQSHFTRFRDIFCMFFCDYFQMSHVWYWSLQCVWGHLSYGSYCMLSL